MDYFFLTMFVYLFIYGNAKKLDEKKSKEDRETTYKPS